MQCISKHLIKNIFSNQGKYFAQLCATLAFASISLVALPKVGDDIPRSLFAVVPIDQRDYMITITSRVKPNFMFFIDNLLNMKSTVLPSKHYFLGAPERIDVTQYALKNSVQNPEVSDEFSWNIYTLCSAENGQYMRRLFWADYANTELNQYIVAQEIERYHLLNSAEKIIGKTDNLHHLQSTPATDGWVMATDLKTGESPTGIGSSFTDTSLDEGRVLSGTQLNSAASLIKLFSIDEVASSVNSNGGGESGGDSLAIALNTCVNRDNYFSSLADQSGSQPFKLKAKLCPQARLIRVNIRDITP